MPSLSLDSLQSLLAVLGSLGGFVVFLAVGWWRLSGKFHEMIATLGAVTVESHKMRLQIVHTGKTTKDGLAVLSRKIVDLERSLAVQATILGEREKDIAKLEGKMDQAHEDTLKVVASLSQVMGSLDSVWRTLAKLHPDQVPKRASDRKSGMG